MYTREHTGDIIFCRDLIGFQSKFITNISEGKDADICIARSRLECGVKCSKSPQCLSFSYVKTLRQCSHYRHDFSEQSKQSNVPEGSADSESLLEYQKSGEHTDSSWLYYYVYKGCQVDGAFCPARLGYTWDRAACFCYKLHNNTRNYSNAVLDCKVDFGHLAKIDRQLRQKILTDIIDGAHLSLDAQVRIQGYLKGSQWYYADGSPLLYYNWNKSGGQPDGETGLAVSKEFNYLWHDVSDETELPFLCEIYP